MDQGWIYVYLLITFSIKLEGEEEDEEDEEDEEEDGVESTFMPQKYWRTILGNSVWPELSGKAKGQLYLSGPLDKTKQGLHGSFKNENPGILVGRSELLTKVFVKLPEASNSYNPFPVKLPDESTLQLMLFFWEISPSDTAISLLAYLFNKFI